MPRFAFDPNRLNNTVSQTGKEYNLRLLYRSQAIFTTVMNLLPSNYLSTIEGPNYTQELKAVSVELAKLELALEDVAGDYSFVAPTPTTSWQVSNGTYNPIQSSTRSDFLYSIIGYLMVLNGKIPPTQWTDASFRSFLLSIISIYFQGSIPKSMADAAALFLSGQITVTENFLLLREGAAGLDISDEFGFNIEILTPSGGGFPPDLFNSDSSLRQIIDILRPAHTLYTIRYIFQDTYIPNDTAKIVLDAMRASLSAYYYDDFRSYWGGIRNRDRLGKKTNKAVVDEDHSDDF
jgi:hypothetical protein